MGVISEETILDINLETLSQQGGFIAHGGMEALEQDISKFMVDSLQRSDAYTRLNIPNRRAVIVTGVAGSGKKSIVRTCCRKVGLRMFPLSLARTLSDREIMESNQATDLSYIHIVFERALQSAPSAVILQDLDIIAKDRGVDSTLQSNTVSILCQEMERASQAHGVFVFVISKHRGNLPEVFQKQDLIQQEFHLPIPVKTQRQVMLEGLLNHMANNSSQRNDVITSIASSAAQRTSGYVAKDLRNLCRSALLHSLRDKGQNKETKADSGKLTQLLTGSSISPATGALDETVTENACEDSGRIQTLPCWEDFVYAIETSKPSQQIEFESLATPRGRSDYGGYASLKRRVLRTILWPITNPETFKRMGVRPPMGLLLYGPSGCVKTMLVQTLASQSNMNFIPVKGPEIFSKYLGETEATLRRLFVMARQIAPCILFFDEMDSIGSKRGWGGDADSHGSNGVSERVLSTLLNEMDGVEERAGVFVIGCTNQPGAMDDALLRPGRLDQLIYVGYPTFQD
ncbi:spermatogenesis associated protein 5, partial [Modicella reniformis]